MANSAGKDYWRHPSGLYLPRMLPPDADDEPLDGVMVFITHEEAFGTDLSSQELISLIQRLPLKKTIGVYSRIAAVMHWHNSVSAEFQVNMAQDFLKSPLRERVLELLERGDRGFIFEEQLLIVLKLVMTYADPASERFLDDEDQETLIRIALGVTSLISREEDEIYNTPEEVTMLTVRGLYSGDTQSFRNLIARYFDIYLNQPRLHPAPPIDLDAEFKLATGLSIREYLTMGMLCMAHYARFQSGMDLASGQFSLAIAKLGLGLADTRSEVAFWRLMSTPLETFREKFTSLPNPLSPAFGASLMPFFQSPLLEIEGGIVIPISLRLLQKRLADGIHWILIDHFSKTRRMSINDYTSYLGQLFQQHATQVLRLVFPSTNLSTGRFHEPTKYGKSQAESFDGLVVYPDSLVAFEMNSSRVRYRQTILEGSHTALLEDIDRCVVQKAGQLERVLKDLRSGKFTIANTPNNLRVYPVILHLEPFPEFPLVWADIDRRLKSRGYLQNTEALQLISMEDLEWLEVAVASGHSTLPRILEEKGKDPSLSQTGMKNFLLKRYPNLDSSQNSRIRKLFGEVIDQVKAGIVGKSA